MRNIIIKNGKRFIRPARLPRGAYTQKSLKEVTEIYRKQKKKKEGGE
jgi:hypothetical protein